MSDLKVRTNNVPRDLVAWHDVPEKIRQDWFDYVTDEDERYSLRFFEYLGSWYDSGEFELIDRAGIVSQLKNWDGAQTQSFFDAIVIRYQFEDFGVHGKDVDYERVVVGRATW
jgi:hypothetical protein